MIKLRYFPLANLFLLSVACFVLTFPAQGQLMYTDLEASVRGLPSLVAKSNDPEDVLRASLEIIIHNQSVCCGRDSALEDSVERADPLSLKDVASRLQGRHLLSDGRPIAVAADFLPGKTIDPLQLVNSMNDKHAMLMEWNSDLYVVYSVIYRWIDHQGLDLRPYCILRKLELVDTRYSDSRRWVEFNRDTDDPAKLGGFLIVTFAPQ